MKKRATSHQSADVGNKKASDSDSTLFMQLKNVLLVVGAPLIIFAAFRNSLTWHLQRFWGASGNFWQAMWDQLVDRVGEDEFTYYFYGTLIVSTAVYWIWGTMFTILDVTLKPAALRKYKIQPGTNEPVDSKRLRKVMAVVVFNQIFVNIPMAYVGFYLSTWRGIPSIRELPSFHRVLFELVICLLMEEVGFYYSHRLLHQRSLYRHIHKMHHEWTSPIGWAALYAHPVEYAVSNVAPLFAGPLLVGSHIATFWLWFIIGIINTVNSHSGYHLPFAMSPEAHDFHHLKLLHNKYLYRHIHKLHHEWTAPISLTAMYAHPIEHAVSNIGPLFLGPLVAGSHISFAWLWFAISLISTLNDHSGYHLPFATSAEFHDFHHAKFTQNFGALGLMDRLHNTDVLFRTSGTVQRHRILTCLTPMRTLYPLSEKRKVK